MLQGKKIVLGITGGIAAYKSAELIRQIIKQGGQVHVIMTQSAQKFVAPLTLQTLSGNPVTTDMFKPIMEKEIAHISLAQISDVLVIAPATANIIGKIAHGIADDMLTTVVMATKAPVLIVPAMNVVMWENPILQDNIKRLKTLGYHFVKPAWGELACGVLGQGRLAETVGIFDEIVALITKKDFTGQKALVTAGPTREMIDPVRYISNPSSGKTGFAIAKALKNRGAQVTLITGPTSIAPPRGVECISVQTAEEMRKMVKANFGKSNIVIKAAAVADWKPKSTEPEKIKKTSSSYTIKLERTRDILEELGKKKGNKILVGFAAETQELIKNAREKLQKKNLDLIVANDVSKQNMGFGSDINKVHLISKDGKVETLPPITKDEIAHKILDRILLIKKQRNLL